MSADVLSQPHIPVFAQPLTRRGRIECKPELVVGKLQKFYQNCAEIDKLMPYLTGTAPISLRIIDWFVTKESRRNFTQFILNNQKFVVFLSYKGQLRAYSKKYFDPNCRRERISFEIPGKEPFLTTIGKLNFFRWAHECKVLEYIEANIDTLRDEYNTFLRENTSSLKKSSETSTLSSTGSSQSASAASAASGKFPNSGTSSASSTQSSNTIVSEATSIGSSTISSASSQSASSSQICLTALNLSNPNRTTRRRRSQQIPSSLQQLQIQNDNEPIVLDFN